MSKPRYNWWSFAINMIYDYPKRKLEREELQAERTDICELPPQEQREYDAVSQAIEMQRALPKADLRKKVVRMTLIRHTHTTVGAAMFLEIPVSEAKQYRWDFIVMVGGCYGFLNRSELEKAMKASRMHKSATKAKEQ